MGFENVNNMLCLYRMDKQEMYSISRCPVSITPTIELKRLGDGGARTKRGSSELELFQSLISLWGGA